MCSILINISYWKFYRPSDNKAFPFSVISANRLFFLCSCTKTTFSSICPFIFSTWVFNRITLLYAGQIARLELTTHRITEMESLGQCARHGVSTIFGVPAVSWAHHRPGRGWRAEICISPGSRLILGFEFFVKASLTLEILHFRTPGVRGWGGSFPLDGLSGQSVRLPSWFIPPGGESGQGAHVVAHTAPVVTTKPSPGWQDSLSSLPPSASPGLRNDPRSRGSSTSGKPGVFLQRRVFTNELVREHSWRIPSLTGTP